MEPTESGISELVIKLNKLLPVDFHEYSEVLARIIISSMHNHSTPSIKNVDLDESLRQVTQLLTGQTVSTNRAILSFNENDQLGDITIRDIAGGNIITVNFHFPSFPTQPVSSMKEDKINPEDHKSEWKHLSNHNTSNDVNDFLHTKKGYFQEYWKVFLRQWVALSLVGSVLGVFSAATMDTLLNTRLDSQLSWTISSGVLYLILALTQQRLLKQRATFFRWWWVANGLFGLLAGVSYAITFLLMPINYTIGPLIVSRYRAKRS